MYGVETLGEKLSRIFNLKNIPTITLKARHDNVEQKRERLRLLIEFQSLVNQEIGELFYQLGKEKVKA